MQARSTSRSLLFRSSTAILAALVALGVGCESASKPEPLTDIRPFGVEPDIRVRIRDGVELADIGAANASSRLVARGLAGRTETMNAPVKARAGVGGIELTDLYGRRIVFGDGADVQITMPDANAGAGLVRVDGTPYASSVVIKQRSDLGGGAGGRGRFDIIATLPMEQYIEGVVSKELIASWPLGAYEAQAIAARSYAMHERTRARAVGRSFDVESTTADQVFGGSTTLEVAKAGTRNTRGLVLVEGGRTLRAYYSSTCGGKPNGATDVWPFGPGYEYNRSPSLQARSRAFGCQGSPLFRWRVERDLGQLSQRVRAWGQTNGGGVGQIGTIRSIESLEQNIVGRPTKFRLTDDKGKTYTLSAEQLRFAANQNVPGLPDITREVRMHSGNFQVLFSGNRAVFEGGGFGHGVGMCQYCAKGWADQGLSYREMLARFYPGATVQRQF
ncbi:MAG: SpoIID/LytB domain-containing protein [Phycisphaeraceae bacterium]|nr:SpoIID/LytB domain-containing protein [Phycisphaeraceae bacterium]MBX3367986.1 SpoIID/LytB domain-containing protein [Phycisphaeraceae bacterium]